MLMCQEENNNNNFHYNEKASKNNNKDENNNDYRRKRQQEMQLNVSDDNRECGYLEKKISCSKRKKMRKSNFPRFSSIFLLIFFFLIKIILASDVTNIDTLFHNNTNVEESRIFGHFHGKLIF